MNRQQLWETLQKYGVSEHLINLCKNLYNNSKCAVRTSRGLSEKFTVRSGVRQGCVLSPLLFITYIDNICKLSITNNDNNINEILFADDQVIIAETEHELQQHLDNLKRIREEYSMRINKDKTEVMVINKGTIHSNVQIGNEKVTNVSELNYLGSIISSNGKVSTEIDNNYNKASQILGQLTPVLKNKHVNLDTKRTLYNTIFIPSLCYQCQTWTLTSQEKRKITTTEMRCLRRILNITRR